MPFSDPLADGPVIQRATERALAAGATLPQRAGHAEDAAPGHFGADRHLQLRQSDTADGPGRVRDAKRSAAGVDGVLTLDVPPEEGETFRAALRAARD